MNFWLLPLCVVLSAAGWWLGPLPGILWSLLVTGGLAAARQVARCKQSPGPLALMPTWQIALVPLLAVVIGFALGLFAFIVGPGF